MILYVLPGPERRNIVDVLSRASINFANFFAWLSQSVFSSDFSNFIFVQNSMRKHLASGVSVFRYHIFYIIYDRSKKKMFRVDTTSNVTFMAYAKSLWDRAELKFVRIPMGILSFFIHIHSSVSHVWLYSSSPYPAIRSFFNLLPKSLLINVHRFSVSQKYTNGKFLWQE